MNLQLFYVLFFFNLIIKSKENKKKIGLVPDVVMLLNVDFVKLSFTRLSRNVILHFHGHMSRQHRQQQAFLLTNTHTRTHSFSILNKKKTFSF